MSGVDSDNISKVILEKNGKFLVFTRADNGKLDLPGGHCHVGESFEDGAIREVFEECALKILSMDEVISYGKKKIFLTKDFSGEIFLDKSENSAFGWVSKESLQDFLIGRCTDVMAMAAAYINRKK